VISTYALGQVVASDTGRADGVFAAANGRAQRQSSPHPRGSGQRPSLTADTILNEPAGSYNVGITTIEAYVTGSHKNVGKPGELLYVCL
jgi:hypothetical protein